MLSLLTDGPTFPSQHQNITSHHAMAKPKPGDLNSSTLTAMLLSHRMVNNNTISYLTDTARQTSATERHTVSRMIVCTEQLEQLGGLSWHLVNQNLPIFLQVLLSLQ